MVFGNHRLVGEHERLGGAAGVLVEAAADPVLLIGDRIAVVVAIAGVAVLARRGPGIDDDEARVASRPAVVERVAHAVQVAADRRRAAEVAGAERVGEPARLREVLLELRDRVVVRGAGVGLVVAPHREVPDAGVQQFLRGGGTNVKVGVVAVLGEVADLDHELDVLVDHLGVDLLDDRDRDVVGIRSRRIAPDGPLRVVHDAERPRPADRLRALHRRLRVRGGD
jgi:hypothetical protein